MINDYFSEFEDDTYPKTGFDFSLSPDVRSVPHISNILPNRRVEVMLGDGVRSVEGLSGLNLEPPVQMLFGSKSKKIEQNNMMFLKKYLYDVLMGFKRVSTQEQKKLLKCSKKDIADQKLIILQGMQEMKKNKFGHALDFLNYQRDFFLEQRIPYTSVIIMFDNKEWFIAQFVYLRKGRWAFFNVFDDIFRGIHVDSDLIRLIERIVCTKLAANGKRMTVVQFAEIHDHRYRSDFVYMTSKMELFQWFEFQVLYDMRKVLKNELATLESADDSIEPETMYYSEASLSDSTMFKQLNKSSALITKVQKAISTGIALDKPYIEEQYMQIQKTRISPISEKVLRAYDEGKIKLIWNKQVAVTNALPFIVLQTGGNPAGCIFISDFTSMNKEGTMLSIDMKKLYTLMESAYVGLCYFSNPTMFLKNANFIRVFANIYAEMILRILNHDYALSLDKKAYDTVNYMAAKFCLLRVIGIPSRELAHSYATGCCKNIDNTTLELSQDIYDRENPQSIAELIKLLAKIEVKMSNLTFRYFFERWIASFGTAACLGIDSFPYLYFIVANVLLSGFLVNVTGLSEVVKNTKGISTMYAELSRMV